MQLVKTADLVLTFSIYLAGLFASNLGQCPTLLSRWLYCTPQGQGETIYHSDDWRSLYFNCSLRFQGTAIVLRLRKCLSSRC